MRFDNIKHFKPEEFRRLTGVKLATFNKMVEIVVQALKEKKAKGGRPNKLSPSDMVLMTLEYLREYRTYFHISSSYGISESNCYYTIRFVENTLIKSKCFNLPGRKQLLKRNMEYEFVVIDATETPIQRTKKSKKNSIQARKSDIL